MEDKILKELKEIKQIIKSDKIKASAQQEINAVLIRAKELLEERPQWSHEYIIKKLFEEFSQK